MKKKKNKAQSIEDLSKEFNIEIKPRELTLKEKYENLRLENMELKANLDGISLSHYEDEEGEIHYAEANNPYAKEALSRDGKKISAGKMRKWFSIPGEESETSKIQQFTASLIENMRAGNNFSYALERVCDELGFTSEKINSLKNLIPKWAAKRIEHGREDEEFRTNSKYKWASEFMELKTNNHRKRQTK